jgi:hypothetical protein
VIKPFVRRLRPSAWTPSLDVARSLWFDYAHLESGRSSSCVDAKGNPVPWYTYPAIEYLKQLDFSRSSVFEYGSGNSTLFWASRAARVVSVEDDPEWYRLRAPDTPRNCELILQTDLNDYPRAIRQSGMRFDVIVVDGAARGRTRLKCSREALAHLREGGMIILDNSDWLPESARILREADLIEVDMTGFGPINRYAWTTSFFLHRAFAFSPRGARQPVPGPGAREQNWEPPDPTEPPFVECGGDLFGAVRRDERFTMASPSGPRQFRLLVCQPQEGRVRTVALLDMQLQRVTLSLSETPPGADSLEAKLEAVLRMPWPEFERFINSNDQRRYDLSP